MAWKQICCPVCGVVLKSRTVFETYQVVVCTACKARFEVEDPAGHDRHRKGGRATPCDLCKSDQAPASTCYLRIIDRSVRVGLFGDVDATERRTHVRCACCESCYRQLRSLEVIRHVGMGMMLGVPLLLGGGGCLFLALLEKLGVPKDSIVVLVIIALVLSTLSFFLTPVCIRMATRHRISRLLSPAMDDRLRALGRVRGWGLKNYLTATKSPPEEEPILTLPSTATEENR